MFIYFLFHCLLAEKRTLNLNTYIKGLWNCTVYSKDEEDDFLENKDFFEILFQESGTNLYSGTTKGLENEYNVSVKIDQNNTQLFNINMIHSHESLNNENQINIESEMIYYRRNMPVARGQWGNESQHFKLLVFSPYHFEIYVFNMNSKTIDLLMFMKTHVPDINDVFRALGAPLLIGAIFIAYKLNQVRDYINNQEEQRAGNAQGQNGKTKQD